MKIDYQTIYIIVIIVFFNFLLLNIFRLQNDIHNISKNIKNNKNVNGFNSNNKYKSLNNNNNSIGGIKDKLNDIASIVPIDVNKIDKTNANFVPKFKQVDNL